MSDEVDHRSSSPSTVRAALAGNRRLCYELPRGWTSDPRLPKRPARFPLQPTGNSGYHRSWVWSFQTNPIPPAREVSFMRDRDGSDPRRASPRAFGEVDVEAGWRVAATSPTRGGTLRWGDLPPGAVVKAQPAAWESP